MRIIKAGSLKPQEWLFVCSKCGCEFAANKKDMHEDQREGAWVVCPTCRNCIDWSRGDKL